MVEMTIQALQLFEKKKSGLAKSLTHAQKALAIAKTDAVDTPEAYTRAGDRILIAKQREELINDVREEIVVPLGRAHRTMSAVFKKNTDAWRAVWGELHSKRVAYDREQKKAHTDREREVRRLQLEEAAKERAFAATEAKAAEERGEKELASELRSEAERPIVPIAVAPVTPPKTEGLQTKKTYKARIGDLVKVPMTYCRKVPEMAVLHGLARTAAKRYEGDIDKANADAPAGVVFYEDSTPAKV